MGHSEFGAWPHCLKWTHHLWPPLQGMAASISLSLGKILLLLLRFGIRPDKIRNTAHRSLNLIYSVKSLYKKDGQGLRLKFWAQGVLRCLLNSPIGLKRWSSPKGWALLKESPGLVAVWRRSLCLQVEKGAPGALPGQSRAHARHVHWLSASSTSSSLWSAS